MTSTAADQVKILVAEDEKDIRELVSITMKLAGYQVFTASDGAEALDMVTQIMPDLILMDVRMPKMTGYEACVAIKKIPQVQDIPVVFLSAKGQETEIQQGLAAGAVAYVLKPFAPTELTAQIKALLAEFGKKESLETPKESD
ncbi:MAG: response regulator transcription factor [Chloroflexota bacterium]